jgi:hypothetical protein
MQNVRARMDISRLEAWATLSIWLLARGYDWERAEAEPRKVALILGFVKLWVFE